MNLAILFHDIEYDPKAKDNELQSILQFKSFAEDAHLSPSIAESVALFIERTITHTLEGDGDNLLPNTRKDLSLFLDMDLEVLSRQKGEYEKYAHQIRQEYSHFSHQDYCTGRAKVLRSFLERDRLYFSEIFYNQGESAARRNIKEEIQVLEGHFE
jgi:predicted metal-dependent HD superfamily phosphohydrolase